MKGLLVVATVFFLAASCLPVAEGSICLNDSTSLGGGGDGNVLLVGKYIKTDSIHEQYQNLEALVNEQLDLQRMQLQGCQGFYRDCEDVYKHGVRLSGVYTIQPDEDQPFKVYCDMETDSGGWTVFQRRKDGSVDFYREWMDYARGFGNLTGEFWLGLRNLHRITSLSRGAAGNELRVDMEDFEENTAYAKYRTFAIGDSTAKYILSVSGYSGTAGDSLAGGRHDGHPFSTKDEDNDIWSDHCAQVYKGGWWYDNCYRSNLNGLYLRGHHSTYGTGVNWYHWKGYYYSLKFTEMKLRRR